MKEETKGWLGLFAMAITFLFVLLAIILNIHHDEVTGTSYAYIIDLIGFACVVPLVLIFGIWVIKKHIKTLT